jgi:hypothetical protein
LRDDRPDAAGTIMVLLADRPQRSQQDSDPDKEEKAVVAYA